MKRAFRWRRPWPVVVAVVLPTLVLGGLLFGLALYSARGPGADATERRGEEDGEANETGRSIATFATFTSARSAGQSALPDREYAAMGVRRLTDAIDAIAHHMEEMSDPHGPAPADVDELRAISAQLEQSPVGLTRDTLVRRAFDITTAVLTSLQRERFSALTDAVDAMRITSAAFEPGHPASDQRAIVERYFEQASDVLRAMWKMGL